MLLSIGLYAQDRGYGIMEFSIKDGNENELIETYLKSGEGVEMVDGSFLILQEIGMGGKNMTHRMIWSWELGVEWWVGIFDEKKIELFWSEMQNHVEEWGEDHMGRILSWKGGSSENNYTHVWDLKVSNPIQFKIAHDKIVKRFEKEFEGRSVGFGSYDFNRPNGASHWVSVSGSGDEDHLMLYNELEKQSDFFKLLSERGTVEDVGDVQFRTLIRNFEQLN